jgi:putative endonuclease
VEKDFIRLQVCDDAAHNPAAAGSLVQIQPPQPIPRVPAIYSKRAHYIGLTEDVAHRVQQHNSGMTRSTRGKGPWELIWTSDRLGLADVRRLELNLKRQKGGNGFYQITGLHKLLGLLPAEAGQPPQPNHLPHARACAKFNAAQSSEKTIPE